MRVYEVEDGEVARLADGERVAEVIAGKEGVALVELLGGAS